jgi:hypothetical protein
MSVVGSGLIGSGMRHVPRVRGVSNDGVAGRTELDFPRCLEADFPDDLPGALSAFESIADAIVGADLLARAAFAGLERLRLASVSEMQYRAHGARRRGAASSRVLAGRMLDYGRTSGTSP